MYKLCGNQGLFDKEETYEKLVTIGNPLEKISKVVDFEMFREKIETKLLNQEKKSNTGARPYDVFIQKLSNDNFGYI